MAVEGFSVNCGAPEFVDIKSYSIDDGSGAITETVLFPDVVSLAELSVDESNALSGAAFEQGFNVISSSNYTASRIDFEVEVAVNAPGTFEFAEQFIRCPWEVKVRVRTV